MSSPERLAPKLPLTHPPTHPRGTINQMLQTWQIGSRRFKHYKVPGLGLNIDAFLF